MTIFNSYVSLPEDRIESIQTQASILGFHRRWPICLSMWFFGIAILWVFRRQQSEMAVNVGQVTKPSCMHWNVNPTLNESSPLSTYPFICLWNTVFTKNSHSFCWWIPPRPIYHFYSFLRNRCVVLWDGRFVFWAKTTMFFPAGDHGHRPSSGWIPGREGWT